MAELLRPHAAAEPDRIALTDESGDTTWGAFDARVNRLIHALRRLGLSAGDRVAIHSGNRREYYEVMTAAGHAGLRYVLVNWHWTADELAYVLTDSGAAALISDAAFGEVASAAARAAGTAARIVLRGPDGASIPGFADYEALLAAEPADEPDGQCTGAAMIYTSGTTGRPKGVSRTGEAFRASMDNTGLLMLGATMLLGMPQGAANTVLLVGPLYHSAQWLWSLAPLLTGGRVVMRRNFDAAETLDLIERYRITCSHLVPTQFVRLLRLPDERRATFDPSSLVAVWHGAAPCSPQIKRRMIDWWGPVIHEYYGSTEASINTVVTATEWLARPGTVGRSTGLAELHVLREDGTPAAAGEQGQLWFRYPNGADVSYWGDPDKTASIHRDGGLFTTGDIGHLDADGYLYLTDRAIDMIVSGGVNIYPAEIEGVLITHPAVRDVAVFGVPDPEFGEQVKAAVEVEEGRTAGDGLTAELTALCRDHLAGYKVPRSIDYVEAMPRTPTGKLYKRVLREPYWSGTGRAI